MCKSQNKGKNQRAEMRLQQSRAAEDKGELDSAYKSTKTMIFILPLKYIRKYNNLSIKTPKYLRRLLLKITKKT